jgi:hypothetical protein
MGYSGHITYTSCLLRLVGGSKEHSFLTVRLTVRNQLPGEQWVGFASTAAWGEDVLGWCL